MLTLNALSSAARREWEDLNQESDAELRAEAALNFAQRQTQAGRPELAVEVYRGLLAEDGLPSRLAGRAQTSLDAILGSGSFGGRAEFLLRNLAEQATDPSALLAMTAAGAVFRMTRLAALSRFAAEANPGFLTRLLGAGRTASLLGFAVEAPTFTLANRLGSEALGRTQDWGLAALRRDLASSYLVLGGMKFAGGLGQGAATRFGSGVLSRTLVPQASMLTGIMLGRRLEEWAGLREARDGATTLTDSLALLLQFHVAGRLNGSLFGERVRAWENHLDLQSQGLAEVPALLRPQWATGRAEIAVPAVMMIQGSGGDGNGDGNGKGETPPRGRPTLLGLGRESRPPAEPAASKPAPLEAPLFSAAAVVRIEGLNSNTRLIQVSAAPRGQDPMVRILEHLERYFNQHQDSVVVQYNGDLNLETAALSRFKIDLHGLYRERSLPGGTRVSLFFPQEREVVHYRRLALGFQVEKQPLVRSARTVSTVPIMPPTREPSVPRIAAAVPARAPSAPSQPAQPNSAEAGDFEGLKRSFRTIAANLESSGVISPAIRLNQGSVEESALQVFADILGDHPLPEGRKISIFWAQAGGGRVTFQRSGDRIQVERRGYLKEPELFFLLPMDSLLGRFRVFPAKALRSYTFEDYRHYEATLEHEITTLAERMALPKQPMDLIPRDDGGASRGERLARLGLHWLQENGQRGRTLNPSAQEDFFTLHRLLERSQAYLDLGTLQRFRERVRLVKLGEYDTALERFNVAAQSAGLTRLVPLRELGANLPMEYVIPLSDALRGTFCEQLFKSRNGFRVPLENNGLLRDPNRMGEVLRETMRVRALALLATIKMIEKSGLGETPQSLLATETSQLTEASRPLHRDLEFFLTDWRDFGRILGTAGRGATHRQLLSEVFQGSRGITDLYQQVLRQFQALSPEIRRKYRLDQVPAWADLTAAMRGSRP